MRRCRACLNWNHRDRPTCSLCGAMLPAVALVMLVLALTGCLSVSPSGDVGLDINSRDVTDVLEAGDNLIRGAPPTIRLPRSARWLLIAASPEPVPERIDVDEHLPTGSRGGE